MKELEVLFQTKTAFQDVAIIRTQEYGKCLFIDGDLQSAESDQETYHRALVDPAFNYNPGIKSALILGGGEGVTARRILEHPSVESVMMVDIDEELVDICQQHLPEWRGVTKDPKLQIHYDDAAEYVPNDPNQYDLVVWDLVDPYHWQSKGKTAATALYTPEFFLVLKEHLTSEGLLSIEYAMRNRYSVARLLNGWQKIARRNVCIPSFEEKWTFALMERPGLKPDEAKFHQKSAFSADFALRAGLKLF